ncbi:hypothetical protein WDW86_08465 [Bdellovibrionota bacterium FG-2]
MGSVLSSSSASGFVQGRAHAGGLIGEATLTGTITDAYTTGIVKGLGGGTNFGGFIGGLSGAGTLSKVYATGNRTGSGQTAGGLIGYANMNTIGSTEISDCYAQGNVGAGTLDQVGGLIGATHSTVNVTRCYASGAVPPLPLGSRADLIYSAGAGTISNSYALSTNIIRTGSATVTACSSETA